jgi:hypothetical protein
MMIDILNNIIGVLLVLAMGWVVWESSAMISEKKERQRRGLTDYYDNPVTKRKCMGGEDDVDN